MSLEQEFNVYAISMPIIEESENTLQDLLKLFENRLESIIDINKTNYILGYSIGVNFAYELAKHFRKKGINIEVLLIDRGPVNQSYKPTTKVIRQSIDYHMPLIENAKKMGIDENLIYKRIAQSVRVFSNYDLKGKIDVPIYTFECDNNSNHDYMIKWSSYTSNFKGVQMLKGSHLEALSKENINIISQTIKKIIEAPIHN